MARALAPEPEVLILDEPTSALDVSVQAQVLNLLKDIKEQMRMTAVFISHDLSVVRQVADDVAVMHRGRIVEFASAEAIIADPQHEYTRSLVRSVMALDNG